MKGFLCLVLQRFHCFCRASARMTLKIPSWAPEEKRDHHYEVSVKIRRFLNWKLKIARPFRGHGIASFLENIAETSLLKPTTWLWHQRLGWPSNQNSPFLKRFCWELGANTGETVKWCPFQEVPNEGGNPGLFFEIWLLCLYGCPDRCSYEIVYMGININLYLQLSSSSIVSRTLYSIQIMSSQKRTSHRSYPSTHQNQP